MPLRFASGVLPIDRALRCLSFALQGSLTAQVVLVLILLFQGTPGHAANFSGRVTDVVKGDTLVVVSKGHRQRIRLFGVDAPDLGEPFGLKAKQFIADLALGRQVSVELHGMDRDKHILGEVFLEDGHALGEGLVQAGFARWYRAHSRDAGLGQRQQESSAAVLGLAVPRDHHRGDQNIVTQGLAWWHWKHVRDQRLKSLEAQARAEGRGMWSAQTLLPL